MTADTIILVLRVLFALVLYAFLAVVAWLAVKQVRGGERSSQQEEPKTKARLILVEPADSGLKSGTIFPLEGETSIGRDSSADIVLVDAFVSSRHAIMSPLGDRWIIEDLKSTNGTLVNSQRVPGRRELQYGDVIQIGPIKLKLID